MTLPGPVMVDLKDLTIDAEEREMLRHPACGGVILFARNIENHRQVRDLNQQIAKINPQLLLAVDQEGGRVQRLKHSPFTLLPPLRTIERTAGSLVEADKLAFHHARLMALETLAVGFDISFAPVLDLCTGTSRVIGDRALHEDPEIIARLAKHYVQGMTSVGMSATGKHFPGHGSVDADSHIEIPIDCRSFDAIEGSDLRAFSPLMESLGGIMPAHVIYPEVDDKPAGFSTVWIEKLLREKYRFDGVVFSDDLSMKGAEVVGGFCERADAAIHAGCDMVLVCNQPGEAGNVLEHLRHTSSSKSADRILRMKAASQSNVGLQLMQTDARWKQSAEALSKL